MSDPADPAQGTAAEKEAGSFPSGVDSAVQYGPEVTAKVADAVLAHHIPVHRSTLFVMELCGVKVSTGFAASLRGRAARLLPVG